MQKYMPKNAIIMQEDKNGFKYPKINDELCINCGLCAKVCPVMNKLKENSYRYKYMLVKIRTKSYEKKVHRVDYLLYLLTIF